MNYTLEKIGTVAACDTLLATALKKKEILERKRRNLGEAIDRFRNRLDQIAKDRAEVLAMLGPFTRAYHTLPEGKYKANVNVKVKRLELRQALLDKKAFTCNVQALLAKQIKFNMLSAQVSAIDAYIAAVQNKRTELNRATVPVRQASDFSRPPVVHQSGTLKTEYRTQMISSGTVLGPQIHGPVKGLLRNAEILGKHPDIRLRQPLLVI